MSGVLDLVFTGLWAVFGSSPLVPAQVDAIWEQTPSWTETLTGYAFRTQSTAIPEMCRQQPDKYLDFPMVIDGAHEIFLDGKLFLQFSDPTFQSVRSIYGKPSISCRDIGKAKVIVWQASTDSKFFARFRSFPEIEAARPNDNFYNEALNMIAAGTLLIMGIFCFIVFTGKVSTFLTISYLGSNVFLAIYFVCTVSGLLSFDTNMLMVHKIGDSSLGFGSVLMNLVLCLQGLINRRLFIFYAALSAPFFFLQWCGRDGNEVQLGTNLAFLPALLVIVNAVISLGKKLSAKKFEHITLLQLLGLSLFVMTIVNDILVVTGTLDGYMLFSVGTIAQMMFLALVVHETILETYVERDYLRANLELEVKRKTSELETAMKNLKQTQAELIQSAKLASLGTLSAGIAHEINNSINFVSGALPPLEKIILKLEPVSPRDYEVGRKLLHAIKDGVSITVEIVKSLRLFTGLNQAKFKDVYLREVVRSVTTILNPRLKEKHKIVCEIPGDLVLFGDVVGINQILMNLITNAIDAMPDGGSILVTARRENHAVVLKIKDSGRGIPEDVKARIFDPFFTTKDVGQGTGLGLYIISNELKKYNGVITVESAVGAGTTFRLTFPDTAEESTGAATA